MANRRITRSRTGDVGGTITHGSQLTQDNTGVPAGTTLTEQTTSGGTIPAGNYVDKLFPDPSPDGFYIVPNDGVTMTRCRVLGGLLIDTANDHSFDRCDFQLGLSISSSHRIQFTRCKIYDGSDLMQITGDSGAITRCQDVTLSETLIWQPGNLGPGDHCDGLQCRGVERLVLERVSIQMGEQFDNDDGSGGIDPLPLNAAFFLENANGGSVSVSVTDSYFDGGTQVTFWQAATGTLTVTGNRWGPLFSGDRVRNDGNGFVPTTWADNAVLATGVSLGPGTSS